MIVAVLGADLWVLANYNRATPVHLEDALGRYRAESGAVTPSSAPPEVAPSDPGVAAPVDAAPPAPVDAAPPAPVDAAPPAPPVAPSGLAPPTPGVYAYTSSGNEALGTTRRSYPSTTYAMLQLGEGCAWTLDHQVLQEHTDRYSGCNGPTSALTGWFMHREFLGMSIDKDYQCTGDPLLDPARRSGTQISIECQVPNDDEHISMRLQDLGPDDVAVGGQTMTAVHIAGTAEMTGFATGTATLELWLDPATGMRLREIRTVDAQVDAKVTTSRYTENAEFVLQSLVPRQ